MVACESRYQSKFNHYFPAYINKLTIKSLELSTIHSLRMNRVKTSIMYKLSFVVAFITCTPFYEP